jgi:pSer/pThr/pTyr-binding forkhead associated (FHA) protein
MTAHAIKYLLYGGVFGAVLGLLLGVVESLALDSGKRLVSISAIGAGVGFAGGAIGILCGQVIYAAIAPSGLQLDPDNPASAMLDLVGRALGWGLIGAMVGIVPGIAGGSVRLIRQGAFGGLAGGFLGGIIFKAITQVFSVIPHVDILARLAALVTIGALVGFFVGLVQNLMKQAWIKVMVGKNEGKEYLVVKSSTTIGRSELADIGLFGDPEIAQTHAVIEAIPENRRHRLRHIGGQDPRKTYHPTIVNGQIVGSEQWLVDGDTIQIGKRSLLFQEKSTRAAGVKRKIAGQAEAEVLARPAVSSTPSFMATSDVLSQMGSAPVATQSSYLPPTPRFPENAQPPFSIPSGYTPLPPERPRTLSSKVREDDENKTIIAAPLTRGGLGTHFLAMRGPYSGQTFMLGHESMIIGRGTECDIALPADTSVSRNHALVAYENGRHVLSDAGSSNGVYVDGIRVALSKELSAGELVQMGETVLRYE